VNVSYPLLLDALHEQTAPERLVASASGHVLASKARLAGVPQGPLHRFGLAVTSARGGAGDEADRFAAGLVALHRAILRRTLDDALRHLAARTSAGTTLLARQLVQAELADVALVLRECDELPDSGGEAARRTRWQAHQRLIVAGRSLLALMGASGFLLDGPGADLYLAEVAGNVYLHPGTESDRD
jgi:hypothetical protein